MDYTDYIVAKHEFEKAANDFGKILVSVKVVGRHLECNAGFSEAGTRFVEAFERLSKFSAEGGMNNG